jgi:uncharacterized Tic20 family protein
MHDDPFGGMNQTPVASSSGPVDPSVSEWERHYALAMHLSLLASALLLPVVPVLVMYLIKRGESRFVDDHGREALNFQITLLIYAAIGALLVPACGIGFVVLVAALVLALVGMVLAAVAANQRRHFRYPACIRFLRSP